MKTADRIRGSRMLQKMVTACGMISTDGSSAPRQPSLSRSPLIPALARTQKARTTSSGRRG